MPAYLKIARYKPDTTKMGKAKIGDNQTANH